MRRLSLQRWSLLEFRENSVIFALTPLMTRKMDQELAEPTNTRGPLLCLDHPTWT
jgi:hypothetical protein